ncbi:MAG: PKD domain-containing protein [Bacteroidota bacterium]
MKTGAKLLIILSVSLLPFSGKGQSCLYLDNISDFQKDQLCSPVEVIHWDVSYTQVNNNGTPVSIHFDWDDGVTETLPASEGPAGTFSVSATHTYVSIDDRCNYHAVANMVVNGVSCPQSSVEVIVTVWDVDNKNGAYVYANPGLYPVCIGNGATMQFDDDSRFNCVPSQENDNPNETTRWVQWVYGVNHAAANFMSSDVSVDGYTGPWPYTTPVEEFPGPRWGSAEKSLPITVADDNLLGERFQVELRYWNYCNKYTDGKNPVIGRSAIEIVDLPDATITPVGSMCEYNSSVTLTAASGGGTWSGPGIINASTGEFAPYMAGPGTHEIQYQVTDGYNCSDEDTVLIVVIDGPDGFITPVDPLCLSYLPVDLEASSANGTWSGSPAITDPSAGIFDPGLAGVGIHQVVFVTDPDPNGCFGTDTAIIEVRDLPFAEILSPDSSWCDDGSNTATLKIRFQGDAGSTFELDYKASGDEHVLFNQPADTIEILVSNQAGVNPYILTRVTEHNGPTSCEATLADTLVFQVDTLPVALLSAEYDDLCSPVQVHLEAPPGFAKYSWNFGAGIIESSSSQANQIYTFNYADHLEIVGNDTLFTRDDSTYQVFLKVETYEGCVDSVTESITVYPMPNADFYVYPDTVHHPDSTVNLSNMSSLGNWSYNWNYGDRSGENVKEPGTHSYSNFGTFDIELDVFNDHCRDSVTRAVTIMPPGAIAGFFPDTIGCPPLLVHFTNTSLYADTYIWDFDDNQFSSEPNPAHLFLVNKVHKVTMTAIGLSGTDTATHLVSVYDRPQADFTAYPTQSANLKQLFKFTNNSQKASYNLWDFGDGITSAEKNPAHIYEDSGTYTVTLIVWSEQNCPDTMVMENFIRVNAGEGTIDFPTAFVWNGSGPSGGHWDERTIDNTVFHPAVINVREFRMVIYTRWGEQIFETNDVYIGWDGYLKSGVPATEGVYLWKAWVTYVDGVEELLVGDITFLH